MTARVTQWLRGLWLRARSASPAKTAHGGSRQEPVVVYVAANVMEAEMIKALLASEGIDAFVTNTGVGQAYGLQIGKLAEARVLVTAALAPRARAIIEDVMLAEQDQAAEDT